VFAASVGGALPTDIEHPEVAFIGRSNVGKSSLINALTGRKTLARASKTPGRTQSVLFFNLGDRLTLVDLPGYGHAEAPLAARRDWKELMRVYLTQRPELRRVFLLIDSRRGLQDSDHVLLRILTRAGVSVQPVLTKADACKPAELAARREETQTALRPYAIARPEVLATSTRPGGASAGIPDVRLAILEACGLV
jgi:GTP-binding protein